MYEILKLIGLAFMVVGIIGLWITMATQRRCRYCGTKDAPITFRGRRMCIACYKIYLHRQLISWYGGDDE